MVTQPNTPYEGGVFAVLFTIPDDYPFAPPACRFITPVYHPNVDERGQICLSIFERENWNPVWTLELSMLKSKVITYLITNGMTAVLTALCSLLGNPNCDDDALRPAIVREFLEDRYQFDTKARLFTQRFASRDYRKHPIEEDQPEPSAGSTPSIQRPTAERPSNWLSNLKGRYSSIISRAPSELYLLCFILFNLVDLMIDWMNTERKQKRNAPSIS